MFYISALKLITAKSLGEQSLESIIAYAEGGSNTGRPDQVYMKFRMSKTISMCFSCNLILGVCKLQQPFPIFVFL